MLKTLLKQRPLATSFQRAHTKLAPTLEHARKRAGGKAIKGMFEGLSRAAKLHPKADPAQHNIEVIEDVPYALTGRKEHMLDIYRPKTPGPHPVLIYVHGGGFRILSKDTHWIMGLGFAKQGYIVFNINYRLAPQHPFPAAIEDACAAYAWVIRNAARFGGDLDTLVLAGESAGGNLVTALTISACWPRPEAYAQQVWACERAPDAVIAACGYMQLTDPGRYDRRRPLPAFLSDRIHEVSRGYLGPDRLDAYADEVALADVLPFLEQASPPERPLPPFFLPCGTKDPILDDTRRATKALERLGAHTRQEIYPGEVHAFHAFVWRKQAQRCWRDMAAFLREQTQAR